MFSVSPAFPSTAVNRCEEIWQPADWHCDGMSASASGFRRSAVGFHFVAGHLGAGVYIGLSLAGDKSLNR
jgi:hypothetical protein